MSLQDYTEIDQLQLELFSNAPVAKRVDLLLSLTEMVFSLTCRAIRTANQELDSRALQHTLLEQIYQQSLADSFNEQLRPNDKLLANINMSNLDILSALISVVDVLENLGISYHIGGSFASSAYGVPRATADFDLMADLKMAQIDELVKILAPDFYLSENSIKQAIIHRRSFNIIHLATMMKIDIFIPADRDYDREVMRRAKTISFGSAENSREFYVKSPEDIILTKLEWYQLGGNSSQRQWSDIIGVLKVQKTLDFDYLEKWAIQLGLSQLLAKAKAEI